MAMWQPIQQYHVLCFPDTESVMKFEGAILFNLTGERLMRYIGGEPRVVLWVGRAPTGDAECGQYMYASPGALRLAEELGLQVRVLTTIPAEELPRDLTTVIGDAQDRPRDEGQ